MQRLKLSASSAAPVCGLLTASLRPGATLSRLQTSPWALSTLLAQPCPPSSPTTIFTWPRPLRPGYFCKRQVTWSQKNHSKNFGAQTKRCQSKLMFFFFAAAPSFIATGAPADPRLKRQPHTSARSTRWFATSVAVAARLPLVFVRGAISCAFALYLDRLQLDRFYGADTCSLTHSLAMEPRRELRPSGSRAFATP